MRNELRFLTNAIVYMVDNDQNRTEASLRDLSQHGLSIKSEGFIDIAPNSPYVIAIVPEEETNLDKFRLEIESRWIKMNKSSTESGFSVIVPFNEKEFGDYLEYLASKNKTDPSSGAPQAEPEPLLTESALSGKIKIQKAGAED